MEQEEKKVSSTGVFFFIMLGFAILFDLADIIANLFEIFASATIPFASAFIDLIAAIVVGIWLKRHGITPTKGPANVKKSAEKVKDEGQRVSGVLGKSKAYTKQIIISFFIEQIPFIGGLLPTWTLNVISVLEERRTLYLIIATTIIIAPLFVMGFGEMIKPDPASAGIFGHSVEYPKDSEKQKMVDCINNYIESSTPSGSPSPYKGMGEDFVKAGEQYEIHPGYIVAMARKESSLCTDSAAGFLCFEKEEATNSPCYNAWGRKKSSENPACGKEGNWWTKYPSWKEGIYLHTAFIKKDYFDKGKTTVEDITPTYCPPEECDTEAYINWIISESEKAACTPLKTTGGANGPIAQKAVEIAKGQLGTPYVLGTNGLCRYPSYQSCPPDTNPPKTDDCSQLTGWAYYWASGGKLNMDSYTLSQVSYCDPIPAGQEQTGDLVFFETCSSTDVDSNHHVGMITKPGEYIHAPHTGDIVKISPLSQRTKGYCVCRIKQEYLQ